MSKHAIRVRGLAGQTIGVTGGGSGLGRQYALDLAKAGASVLVIGRGDNAEAVAEEIRGLGGDARACVAPADDGSAMMDCARRWFGGLDGLVVNAGSVRDRSFAKMTREDWDEVIGIHLTTAFSVISALWPMMIERGGGSIVLTTSGAALHGHFGQANYTAAKGGVIGFMKTLAVEGERRNIRVNAIAPIAATAMTEVMFDAEVAGALLASDVSPFVLALLHPECRETGAIIEAGGGWAAALRWERSAGIRVDPGSDAMDQILARWDRLMTFADDVQHPVSTKDSLAPALAAARLKTD